MTKLRDCGKAPCEGGAKLVPGRSGWRVLLLAALALAATLLVGCGTGPGATAQPEGSGTTTAPPAAVSGAGPTQGNGGLARSATPPTAPDPDIEIKCMDGALFVEDVSISDGTDVVPQQPFTKTWRLRNTGSCTWDATYRLVFTGGDQLSGPESIPLALTPPGATLDLSVDLVAPASRGAFAGLFEIRNPAGEMVPVGKLKSIWVRITVGGGPDLSPPALTAVAGTPPVPRGGRLGECVYSENAAYVQELARLINAARREADLPALQLNSELAEAAQGHSLDMACHNFLNHTGSDGSWIGDRLEKAGYSTHDYSEIIAIGTPENAMAQWRASPSHWESVLDASLTEFGVGYVYVADSDYGGYFTVDIAKP